MGRKTGFADETNHELGEHMRQWCQRGSGVEEAYKACRTYGNC